MTILNGIKDFQNPDNNTYFDIYDGSGYNAQLRHKMANWDMNFLHEGQDYRVPAIAYRDILTPMQHRVSRVRLLSNHNLAS